MIQARGFTLIELIVTIAISSIVLVFAALFIGAPVDAYEAHSRRAELVADAAGAWPRMEADLRDALPNSLRARRNLPGGNFVVIEMLKVLDVGRYTVLPSTSSFNTAGVYFGNVAPRYLSVNNLGTTGADAYAFTGSMTSVATTIGVLPDAAIGESVVTATPAPTFAADSPRQRIYFVEGPVTYLCDEGLGTLRRYANYPIALNQTSYDTPVEFTNAGAAGELVTQGLTSCDFTVSSMDSSTRTSPAQTAAVRLTTTRNGDSVTLAHSVHAEYLP
jgi:prepilin-type N-terminal cleavage/methylation domain-containing protein